MGDLKISSKIKGISRVSNPVKRMLSGANSIIEEGLKSKNKQKSSENPLQSTNEARISFLQNALKQAVALNQNARNTYRAFKSKLSGMIKISSTQHADLEAKRIAYGESDLNEDLLRSSLMDAYHSQAMYYNA